MKMKIIKMLALGSVLSASLVLAQTTTPAAGTSTQTKAQTKAQAKAAKAQAKAAAAAKTAPAKPAAPAAKTTMAPAKATTAPPAAMTAMSAKAPAAPAKTAAAKAAPPSTSDVASAKSKGMVWVNLNTKVYHSSSDKEYGTTKNGKFMNESDAKAAGYKLAKS